MTPLFEQVLIKRTTVVEQKKSLIITPDAHKEKPMSGEVIATGPGKILENGTVRPMSVKVGDKVLFSKFYGTEIPIDEDMLIMKEDAILAVV